MEAKKPRKDAQRGLVAMYKPPEPPESGSLLVRVDTAASRREEEEEGRVGVELIVGLDGWCYTFVDIWAMSTRT